MEHPSKRRRIERRAAGPLRFFHHTGNNLQVNNHNGARGDASASTPKLIITPAQVEREGSELDPSSTVQWTLKARPRRLELRNLAPSPVNNAVNNAPVPQAVAPANQAAYKPANDAVQVVDQALQPAAAPAVPAAQDIGNNANNVAQPVGQAAQPAIAPTAQGVDNTVNQAQQAANDMVQPVEQASQPALAPLNHAADNTVNQAQQAANDVAQPVKQAAEPAVAPAAQAPDKAIDQAQQNVKNIAPVGQNPAGQPVVGDIPKVAPVAAKPAPPAIAEAPKPPQPIDDVPGMVSPPPAEAAAAAREQALAEQRAKDAQEANAPAPEGDSAQAAANANSKSNADAAIQPPVSLQISGSSTQIRLSEPSTPLPQTPSPTPSTSYFSQDGKSPDSSPTTIPDPLLNPSLPLNNNSTMTTSSTVTSSTMTSDSISLTLTTSTASFTGTDSFSMFAATSTTTATSITTSSSLSSSASASFISPSSFLTSTLTPQSSSEDFATASASPSSSSTGGEGLGGSPTSGGGGGGPNGATSSATSASGNNNGLPPTGQLVGGICGGVAGLVLILAALLFFLRWRKGQLGQRRDISPPVPQSAGAGSAALGAGGAMTQRSSTRSSAPIAAAAGLIGRLRPASSQTATTSSTGPSEKGFQKISGRKLPSVLHSGGDGYGDTPAVPAGPSSKPPAKPLAPGHSPFAGLAPALRPPSPQRSLSGSSFYRDSHGFYGGVVPVESTSEDRTDPSSSPTSSSPTFPAPPLSGLPFAGAGHPPGRSSPGIPNIRPGPARQPVIQHGGVVPMRTPSRPGASQNRPAPSPIAETPRDPLGRSHPSQDGSRQSRFRESTTPP